ncbi:MAG: glycoside hydrolase family 2 protein [Bacteroidales bacterium]|nr:glycoside hydrolase family 2 protein [Bacteroidales bacterium]
MKNSLRLLLIVVIAFAFKACVSTHNPRGVVDFDNHWHFHLGDVPGAQAVAFHDSAWRLLDLPHDWSIEGRFDKNSPAGAGGGYLNGGIGWYRKTFRLDRTQKGKQVFIDFDGVYRNSRVWINGHLLGFRPNGYISFRYDLTPYVHWNKPNVVAVRVDNSGQPNSRWYSGSGIYRNVRLVYLNPMHFAHWGIFVTTPEVNREKAIVSLQYKTVMPSILKGYIIARIYDAQGQLVAQANYQVKDSVTGTLEVNNPHLWSPSDPYLYTVISSFYVGDQLKDRKTTQVGIRTFHFDVNKGFFLNGKHLKILGVCNHYDYGCLGTASNRRAIQRRLEILKKMGVNALRTSHNPPDPQLLDLADKMGFMVMDEAFDMWEIAKTKYDYSQYFDQWHRRDLSDQVRRDRNHPSVIIWSVGNEIPEQGDPKGKGAAIMKNLCSIVHSLDTTRPIVTANDHPDLPDNPLITCGATDLIGVNYHLANLLSFQKDFPGKKLIATESASAFETRGWYRMPSDSALIVPKDWRVPYDSPTHFCSSYDNTWAPWGSSHEANWKVVKAHPYISGTFIWTGFDYIGEPTPFVWPSRSSYFGIVDLAGFPKDIYYMYQSEWTHQTVLHIFPHWNWKKGQLVDVWAYYNNADEVELFLNGKSLGKKHKTGDQLHVMWRVKFEPGTLKAVSYKDGKQVKVVEEKTAGPAARVELTADRNRIKAGQKDLSYVSVLILDKDGTLVPRADNLVNFSISGPGKIVGVSNGNEVNLDPFKADYTHAFFGKCMVVVESTDQRGVIHLTATSKGLKSSKIDIVTE